jgi:hypothetical protein
MDGPWRVDSRRDRTGRAPRRQPARREIEGLKREKERDVRTQRRAQRQTPSRQSSAHILNDHTTFISWSTLSFTSSSASCTLSIVESSLPLSSPLSSWRSPSRLVSSSPVNPPALLLAGHLEGDQPVLVYRVADLELAIVELEERGWRSESVSRSRTDRAWDS